MAGVCPARREAAEAGLSLRAEHSIVNLARSRRQRDVGAEDDAMMDDLFIEGTLLSQDALPVPELLPSASVRWRAQ